MLVSLFHAGTVVPAWQEVVIHLADPYMLRQWLCLMLFAHELSPHRSRASLIASCRGNHAIESSAHGAF